MEGYANRLALSVLDSPKRLLNSPSLLIREYRVRLLAWPLKWSVYRCFTEHLRNFADP
jgi:hypothetical protein